MDGPFCIGFGVGTKNEQQRWLEVFYAQPWLRPSALLADTIARQLDCRGGNELIDMDGDRWQRLREALQAAGQAAAAELAERCRHSQRPTLVTLLESDQPLRSTPEAYLKLHLLSHRLVTPHSVQLDGLFATLPNVAWTNEGAIDPAELPARQLASRLAGRLLSVDAIDKFPKMTDYVVPSGVRIADTARVRLGAYLGEGTTIMHEGFVNFNAGTLGTSMVEGRISAGVVVGDRSDLGGGCSTMGTLSGGGDVVISLGQQCLIGANAGVGIPLGDRCTVESGLYLTAGTKVAIVDRHKNIVQHCKARELAGRSDLLFRRNSLTGAVECLTNRSAVQLNEDLHRHN